MGWKHSAVIRALWLVCLLFWLPVWVAANPDCAGELAHEAIATDLFHGRILGGRLFTENGNQHFLYLVEVENPRTGRKRKALFKPRSWGDEDGWSRTPMEYVAYALNRKLGMDYVPPVAYRRWVWIGNEQFSEGALIYKVPDASLLFRVDDQYWGLSKRAVMSDLRILNVLLKNPDGHEKNVLYGKHWVDGIHRPIFIDFGASFREGTYITMTAVPKVHALSRTSEPVRHIRAQTLKKLRRLSREDLRTLSEFLSREERNEILVRRDGIVRYFEGLINEKGYPEVVLAE